MIRDLSTPFLKVNGLMESKMGKLFKIRNLTENLVYYSAFYGSKAMGKLGSKKGKSKSKSLESSSSGQRLKANENPNVFNLNYTEEQELIKESFKSLTKKIYDNQEHIDESGMIPEDIWQSYRELDMPFLFIPETLGGCAQTHTHTTMLMILETLGKANVSVAWALTNSLRVVHFLVQYGTKEQQTHYLEKFLDTQSNYVASIAINEPYAIFSAYQLNTTAKKEGNKYILNGEKNMVALGNDAEFFLVSAKVNENDTGVFIIESNVEGVTITKERNMGMYSADTCKLTLENVEVDDSMRVGTNHHDKIYQEFISQNQMHWSALSTGGCMAVLDYVKEYVNDRKAFGEPISHRQAVAFMVANIKIELDGMRLLSQRAFSRAELGLDYTKESYLAYVQSGKYSMEIASNGLQLLGGHGYIRDFHVQRWYRDLRASALCLN